ncbi:hypothetical protein DOTSEDRAFT_71637 [Dothistroma septosporum NZE10]|uniref:CAP-Gly domain-containing protein n=1 Tax=Dothistroma septosporum (strain NZE10 / CBS 128990) TaxID=675120 RepID=N1PLI6_DOTSN|nr:hypothetical protein DOTSEDRAFT_71637 [Dothistroma septosporum NZE10]
MALHTPRQRSGLQRPSYTASSPSLRASAADMQRKASLQALTGAPTTPGSAGMDVTELEVGDIVNVPGDMFGAVRFVGTVKGKSGKFVGVELAREFSARGKNDGDVDGTQYFSTSIPGSGIFLPVHRAEKRDSPAVSLDSFPVTPNTPTYSTINGQRAPPTSSGLKFSQSVGPGARPSSPTFKPKRPSLPRPESPFRRPAPDLRPTPARQLSASTRTPGRGVTPSKNPLSKTTTSRPSTANSQSTRPYSRTGSRLGHRQEADIPEDRRPSTVTTSGRGGSQGSAKSFAQPPRSSSRLGSRDGAHEQEVSSLRAELVERDKRLAEQAANLADMEASVKELSGLIPADGNVSYEKGDHSTAELRQMLREKNEKITILTSEFDAHRADFRSTLDSLEMASTETERVYEEQKRDLLAQIEELSERNVQLEELGQSKKEFDDVARQLKQLEEFVQELEEGLEDARRGEAEARGEVEFLRGEVERGRSELKREREKAAAAINGSGASPKEVEQKDDEIRGLKAIIHNFSTSPQSSKHNSSSYIKPSDEVSRLQAALDDSQKAKEELEEELEQLRRDSAITNGHAHARNESEQTAKVSRPRADTIKATPAEHAETLTTTNGHAKEKLFCEMCESSEHDTLDCDQFQTNHDASTTESEGAKDVLGDHDEESIAGVEKPAPLSPTISMTSGKEHEKQLGHDTASDKTDADPSDKWCALCEKEGHLAYECPDEQY